MASTVVINAVIINPVMQSKTGQNQICKIRITPNYGSTIAWATDIADIAVNQIFPIFHLRDCYAGDCHD